MVRQSKKKKKNVQRAEAKTPEEDSSLAAAEDVSTEQAEASDVPAMPFDLTKLSPEKIALAEEMGIPLKQLFAWAVSVERRFEIIAEDVAAAPQNVVNALKEEGRKAQKERIEQMQQGGQGQPQQGGGHGDLRFFASLLQGGGGGGGMDAEMMKLTKDMMGMNIQRMKNDMSFTDAIKRAIVGKIAGKATADIMEGTE